jgi:hypothetical protein
VLRGLLLFVLCTFLVTIDEGLRDQPGTVKGGKRRSRLGFEINCEARDIKTLILLLWLGYKMPSKTHIKGLVPSAAIFRSGASGK